MIYHYFLDKSVRKTGLLGFGLLRYIIVLLSNKLIVNAAIYIDPTL